MIGMQTLSNAAAWAVQVGLIVGAAFAAISLLRVDSPALRHGFLRAVLAGCLLLPFVQPARSSTVFRSAGVATSGEAVVPAGTVPVRRPGPAEIFERYVPPAVASVLLVGITARVALLITGLFRLRRLRRAGTEAADPRYADLQRTIGTRATIRSVSGLGQPVTFGFRDAVVLLPQSLSLQPADIRRAVVAHELWHVRRRDWLWTVAEEAVRALFWFHPAIWILLSRIQGTREEVVDRLAIRVTGSRRSYVDALLTYAGESPLCGSTAFGRRRHLVHRLVLISQEAVMSTRRVVACGAILVVVTACSGWYAAQAFPMLQVADAVFTLTPGPLEQSAHNATPENPVPRRIHAVAAEGPAEAVALGVRGTATVMLTVDGAGRVAEARPFAYRLESSDPAVLGLPARTARALGAVSHQSYGRTVVPSSADALLKSVAPDRRHEIQQMLTAFGREAARAAGQWQYEPPAAAPLAFAVVVPVGGDAAQVAAALRESARPTGAVAPRPRSAAVPAAQPPAAQERPGFEAPSSALEPDGALRVGGTIKAPIKTRHVNPMYPPDAMDAKVSGVVILETRIEPDGTVSDVKVLRSIPMLDEAAIGAVQQWEFTPTHLNGEPVAVIMTVTVNFTLQ